MTIKITINSPDAIRYYCYSVVMSQAVLTAVVDALYHVMDNDEVDKHCYYYCIVVAVPVMEIVAVYYYYIDIDLHVQNVQCRMVRC